MSATLDSILDLLHARGMDDALLREGEPVQLRRGTQSVSVTRQPIVRDQLLQMLDASIGRAGAERVWPREYALADGRRVGVEVAEGNGEGRPWEVVFSRRRADTVVTPALLDRRASNAEELEGATRRKEDLGASHLTAALHPGRRASDRGWGPYPSRADALLELERLLRKQVASGAADLHLRVGEPPVCACVATSSA
jgi:hypothetical protein